VVLAAERLRDGSGADGLVGAGRPSEIESEAKLGRMPPVAVLGLRQDTLAR